MSIHEMEASMKAKIIKEAYQLGLIDCQTSVYNIKNVESTKKLIEAGDLLVQYIGETSFLKYIDQHQDACEQYVKGYVDSLKSKTDVPPDVNKGPYGKIHVKIKPKHMVTFNKFVEDKFM